MRLYVASNYGNKERVRRFIDDAIAAGHQITEDWTRAEGNVVDTDLTPEQARFHALNDLLGVRKAQLVIFLADTPEFCGALIEFGHATAFSNVKIWAVRPWRYSIFWELPQVEVIESEEIARSKLGMAISHGSTVAR